MEMKNMNMKKIISLLISVVMICSVFSITAFCAPLTGAKNEPEHAQTTEITLRIEGISDTLYYDTIAVPYDPALTIQDVLIYADETSEKITLTGADAGYIKSVNNETEGTFGGYDGWLVQLNGADISAGIGDVKVSNGDSIVLYYGDPFGVGIQFPEFSYTNGILSVTSKDTTYDGDFKPSVSVNPVSGAKVTIDGTEYTTDEHGQIEVFLSVGDHSISISKYAQNGCPLVLRVASDYKLNVKVAPETDAPVTTPAATEKPTESPAETSGDVVSDTTDAITSDSASESDTASSTDTAETAEPTDVPATGDGAVIFISLMMLSGAVLTLSLCRSKARQ